MTQLYRGFLSNLFGKNFKKLFYSKDAKIISIESKRSKINANESESVKDNNSTSEAPSFLPNQDFPYTYQPMSIFEEEMSKRLMYELYNIY